MQNIENYEMRTSFTILSYNVTTAFYIKIDKYRITLVIYSCTYFEFFEKSFYL